MMFLILFFAVAFVSAGSQNHEYSVEEAPQLFEEFIKLHNKHYEDKEKEERFKIFVDNLKEINFLNKKSSHATFAITKFSDLTKKEFKQRYANYKSENVLDYNRKYKKFNKVPNFTAPAKFDWRPEGVVSRVKDQSNCTSGWAFGVTGNVESAYAIQTGEIVEMSEQQLLDCVHNSLGCDGGKTIYALQYLMNHEAMSSKSYPYKAEAGKCRYNTSDTVVKIYTYALFPLHENYPEYLLREILFRIGPLIISLDALPLMSYRQGILVEGCDQREINHAALLVGYGEEKGIPFWIIKNSWSSHYGEDGYFRIQLGVNCLNILRDGVLTVQI